MPRMKPNILRRKGAGARMLHGIEQLIRAFGEGAGDETDEYQWQRCLFLKEWNGGHVAPW